MVGGEQGRQLVALGELHLVEEEHDAGLRLPGRLAELEHHLVQVGVELAAVAAAAPGSTSSWKVTPAGMAVSENELITASAARAWPTELLAAREVARRLGGQLGEGRPSGPRRAARCSPCPSRARAPGGRSR